MVHTVVAFFMWKFSDTELSVTAIFALSRQCFAALTGCLAVLATAFRSSGQASSKEADQEPGHD